MNRWDYLRIEQYADVYEADSLGEWLLVECEPYGWAYLLTVSRWAEKGEGYERIEVFGADCDHIREWRRAPMETAQKIFEFAYEAQLKELEALIDE